jgi:hypothetical protein
MKLPSDLQELAIECKIAHVSAENAVLKEKLNHLTRRNFLRSKMIWLHGLTMTRLALAPLGEADLIDEPCATDLGASIKCCLDYERKAIDAARRKKEDKARDCMDARDFLLTKIIWQYGAFEICNSFRSIGHDPIDRKELIRILREPAPSAFDRIAEKVERAEKLEQELRTARRNLGANEDADFERIFETGWNKLDKREDEEMQRLRLIEQINNL